ncbi:MAG: DUF368 domain-containing protein [Clostridiales bacterium]|nr:DUF368 domain-containing protein [Roseburia sp.]MDD7636343.1 DUF368 domain-containing protein [Clostridiales bacterium]MDY4113035.1 DUF368 domain-containing protein [Roseburia sp.]
MKFVKDILRGIAIGIANIIPGVSGGTMMVSMGIYDEVICAVTGVFKHFKESVRTLLPYAIGMGIGIVGLSFVIGYLFAEYPLQTAMLFIGLIFGGLPLIFPKVAGKKPRIAEIVVFVAFFGLIIWMQFWGEGNSQVLAVEPKTMVTLFFVGALAAATMVIPGVSGSMMLMSLGYYTPIIDHINAFVIALVTLDFGTVWYCMGILMPFGIGVLLGIFLIAKLVEHLLKQHERMTYFAILGLVTASPIAVLAGMNLGTVSIAAIIAGVAMFGVGMTIAWILGK